MNPIFELTVTLFFSVNCANGPIYDSMDQATPVAVEPSCHLVVPQPDNGHLGSVLHGVDVPEEHLTRVRNIA